MYGSDIDDFTNNNKFRVIYHPSINTRITTEDILELDIPSSLTSVSEYDPVKGEIGLDFKVEKRASADYGNFKEMFIKKAAIYGWLIDKKDNEDLYDCLDSDIRDELLECAYNGESCLLGYPVFSQFDIRIDERYAGYDTQLFQMESYYEDDSEFMAMWDDLGIAHFFINRNKLIEKDFTDILYYWDCT